MKVNIRKYSKTRLNRKIDIEIEHFDTYSMDHTLALIILPMLIQLKNTKQGVPSDFVADIGGEPYGEQDSFDFYQETHNDAFDKSCQLWEETLDKMIWSFQQIVYDQYTDQYHHGKGDYDFVKSDHQFHNPITGKMEDTFQMVDKNPEEHWYDHKGHFLHEERIQEGLELFGKYYRALWD